MKKVIKDEYDDIIDYCFMFDASDIDKINEAFEQLNKLKIAEKELKKKDI